jgi:hypothetical protein
MSGDRDRLVASALLEIAAGDDGGPIVAADALISWSMRLLDVDGAGVMMADDRGVLRAVMVSSDAVRVLEAAELDAGRGPCVETHRTARAVIHADVDVADARWPQFGPTARAGGMRAAHGIPVFRGGTAIGVLNLFRATPGGLTDADTDLAHALTGAVAGAVDPEQSPTGSPDGAGEVAAGSADTAVIEQAKGMMAVRLQVDIDTAFAVLRHVARDRSCTVGDLAAGVVDGTASITLPLTGAQTPSDTADTD